MLNFVAKAFRGWMNILLWLMLIGSAIGGFVGFGNLFATHRGWYEVVFNIGYAFLGLLVGGIGGLIVVILFGGLIANFLNMVDNIEAIRNHLSYSSGGNLSGANLSNVQPVGPSIVNSSGETWTCKKCGEKNPTTSSVCKGCGEYR